MPLISSPPDTADPRRALRARLRERCADISADEAAGAVAAASAWLTNSSEFAHANRIAGYTAVRGELDPLIVLEAALDSGKTVYLPRIVEDFRLSFERWRPGDPMRKNRYGIPEPQTSGDPAAADALDLVIVPLLGFDRTGARLGSGAGYYDRTFDFKRKAHSSPPLLAGYAYALQECEAIAAAAWDVPLDLVVTERGVMRFGTFPTREK